MSYTEEEILIIRRKIVMEAKKLVGVPFRHAGITHSGLDCKGLGWLSYIRGGVDIPSGDGKSYKSDWYNFADENRYLDSLLKYFEFTNNPQIADVVIFATTKRKEIINHAGIYIGKDKFIHARSGYRVTPDNLLNPFWKKSHKGFLIFKGFILEDLTIKSEGII